MTKASRTIRAIATTLAAGSLAACVAVAPSTAQTAEAAAQPAEIASNAQGAALIPKGWRETVISVSDLDAMRGFYADVLGWEERASGPVPPALLAAWGLPESASARYVVMGNPGSARGFVRIVDFDGVEQRRVREHDQPWETGGIFNMNVRVADMAAIAPAATNAGWQGVSAPAQLVFGPFVVWEWIPRQRDGVRIAFIERVTPPLEGWDNLVVSSRTFNSTQIVADLDRARAFYQGVLGFDTYIVNRSASAEPGESVIGLSREAMVEVVRDVAIVNPPGEDNEGSIELLEFEGYSGRDFSAHAKPPNLGNLMLRFPVPDLAGLVDHFEAHGIALEYAPVEIELAPYGTVTITAVRAPDGAWLEFFEEK